MSITTVFRVSVRIPDVVYMRFGPEPEYPRKLREAIHGHIGAGQTCTGAGIQEWADFHNHTEAQACHKRLMDMNYYFAGKLGG